jgi:NAD(P)-dependent dehydrogenase (short-subunit alcohol dehydrogenase family)
MYWKNKVVIITGSSRGIGWELTNQLLRSGASVVINSRNKETLQAKYVELKNKGFSVLALNGDISNYDDCTGIAKNTIDHFGKIDVLINNAGLSAESNSFDSININVFQKLVQVNFIGSVNMTKAALPYIKQSNGSVFFISSLAGLHGLGNYSAYCSSKMALTGFAESLRIELKNQNVHIGIAYIGFTQNDNGKTVLDKNGNLIPQKEIMNVKPKPVHYVANQIIRMIEKRMNKKTFTGKGFLLLFLSRFFPVVLNLILLKLYKKQ